MSTRDPHPIQQLLTAAARTHGVVASEMAEHVGMTRSMVRTALRHGILIQPHRGALVVGGAPRTWHRDVMVASTTLRAPASHRCAARLHRLDGFANAPIELTMRHSGTRRSHPWIVHRTRRVDPRMLTEVDGIPVTSLARTLVDLGSVVDDDRVEQAVDDALRRGANLRWITETLSSSMRPGVTGCDAMIRVLGRPDRDGPIPDSKFERLLERVVTSGGLPAPERQVQVRHGGSLIARLDAAWPERRLGLEADSELWHWGPRRGRRARARHNLLVAAGWQVVYASWQDLEDPAELVRQLRAALAAPIPRSA